MKFKLREIKFKAWDKKRKKIIKVGEINFNQIGEVSHIVSINGEVLGNDFVLLQYTGLKDKNGKEIYEGDILQGWNNKKYGGDGTLPTGYSVVKFENGCFRVFGRPIWDALNDSLTPNSVEVVGNIFENFDLLKT